jgi:hypothetical protein
MGILRDFIDAIRNKENVIRRMLQVKFTTATMSKGAKAMYEELTATMEREASRDGKPPVCRIHTPAVIHNNDDFWRAVKLIEMEADPSTQLVIVGCPLSGPPASDSSPPQHKP